MERFGKSGEHAPNPAEKIRVANEVIDKIELVISEDEHAIALSAENLSSFEPGINGPGHLYNLADYYLRKTFEIVKQRAAKENGGRISDALTMNVERSGFMMARKYIPGADVNIFRSFELTTIYDSEGKRTRSGSILESDGTIRNSRRIHVLRDSFVRTSTNYALADASLPPRVMEQAGYEQLQLLHDVYDPKKSEAEVESAMSLLEMFAVSVSDEDTTNQFIEMLRQHRQNAVNNQHMFDNGFSISRSLSISTEELREISSWLDGQCED